MRPARHPRDAAAERALPQVEFLVKTRKWVEPFAETRAKGSAVLETMMGIASLPIPTATETFIWRSKRVLAEPARPMTAP